MRKRSGDGTISPDEFCEGLERLNIQLPASKMHSILKLVDSDADANINLEEFFAKFVDSGPAALINHGDVVEPVEPEENEDAQPRRLPPMPAKPLASTGQGPEPSHEDKHSRLDATMHAINGMNSIKPYTGALVDPPLPAVAPSPTVSRLLSRAANEGAAAREKSALPLWHRPRSAPAATIHYERYHTASKKTVKCNWELLEQPQEVDDGDDERSISRREAKAAAAKILVQTPEVKEIDAGKDSENTWLKLPRGFRNRGGAADMGFVSGWKTY